MAFAFVQSFGDFGNGVSSFTKSLAAPPTQGSLVVVAAQFFTSNNSVTLSNFIVSDANSNAYVLSTSSPYLVNEPLSDKNCYNLLAYLLPAPGNASASITVSWSNSGVGTVAVAIEVMEFSYGNNIIIGNDFIFTGSSSPVVNAISLRNGPLITPVSPYQELYVSSFHQRSTSGGVPVANGQWTGVIGLTSSQASYLIASGSQTVSYRSNNPGITFLTLGMDFGSFGMNTEVGGVDNSGDYWLGGDEY